MSFERLVKTIHSWLGVMILPWVVAIGFTGLYMNHNDLILSLFPTAHYDTVHFDTATGIALQDEDSARQIAQSVPVPSKDGTGLPSIKEGIQIRWGANQERAILSADNPPPLFNPPSSFVLGGWFFIYKNYDPQANQRRRMCL